MREKKIGLGTRMLVGGIAGLVGTMAMTSAMRRLHEKLPPQERYPLTPREIIDEAAAQADLEVTSDGAKNLTIAGHFAYGAACGALLAAMNPRLSARGGAAAGVGVWLGSYLGWIPATNILKPATDHPPRRNALMIGVHVVWGVTTAKAMAELFRIRHTMIEDGPNRDAPGRGS